MPFYTYKKDIFKTIQFNIGTYFSLPTVKWKNSSILTIQSSVLILFSSVWPKDRTLSSATIPAKSGPGSDGNKGVFRILESSSSTESSSSECLMSYPGNSAEMQSVYSTVLADCEKELDRNYLRMLHSILNKS